MPRRSADRLAMTLIIMYLNIGYNTELRKSDIVGIFDLDNASESKWTRRFLKTAEENGVVFDPVGDVPRSFIVLNDGSVYLSGLSTATLRQRAEEWIF